MSSIALQERMKLEMEKIKQLLEQGNKIAEESKVSIQIADNIIKQIRK